jgi:hypothetical protein
MSRAATDSHTSRLSARGAAPTCASRQNGIWSRPGVIYDAAIDRIFLATGNAASASAGQFDGNHNWSESVIALNPDGSGGTGANSGKPLDSYTPANHVSLDTADADIGSTAPTILPVRSSFSGRHLTIQGGKDGMLRLLDLQNLNGNGGPGFVGREIASMALPQGGGLFSQPAVWVNPADESTWILIVALRNRPFARKASPIGNHRDLLDEAARFVANKFGAARSPKATSQPAVARFLLVPVQKRQMTLQADCSNFVQPCRVIWRRFSSLVDMN